MNRGWAWFSLIGLMLAGWVSRAAYVVVPSSEFLRGSPTNAIPDEAFSDERPQHSVSLPSFYLEDVEISGGSWAHIRQWALTNAYTDLPSGLFGDAPHPVTGITWFDALKWCNARSEYYGLNPVYFVSTPGAAVYRTGTPARSLIRAAWTNNGFRLPTESEWEKAARGGWTNTYYPWGGRSGSALDHINATLANTASSGTVSCGRYAPNAFGLFDMAGNVSEWCWDAYAEADGFCVVRGGSWNESPLDARCAARGMARPQTASTCLGFRCALSRMDAPITEPTPRPTVTPITEPTPRPTVTPTPIPTPTPTPKPPSADADGDQKTDTICYHPPSGSWYVNGSAAGFSTTRFGYEGTLPVSGDYDGDGRFDYGCYDPVAGAWFLNRSSAGFFNTHFGYEGTLPVTGDFDGDGVDDIGCYDPAIGAWYLFKSRAGFWTTRFGYADTVPVTGDYDGDGICDFGCYHAVSGAWFLYKSRDGFWTTQFGYGGTVPVTGDFDGDGRRDFGCYHAASGSWYLFKSRDGFWTTRFGFAGTVPVTGDFDGDGLDDFGCYHAENGSWYLFTSTLGFQTRSFGYAGTIPVF